MGLYEVLIHSQCITHSGWQLACSLEKQPGVPARNLSNVLLWTGSAWLHYCIKWKYSTCGAHNFLYISPKFSLTYLVSLEKLGCPLKFKVKSCGVGQFLATQLEFVMISPLASQWSELKEQCDIVGIWLFAFLLTVGKEDGYYFHVSVVNI